MADLSTFSAGSARGGRFQPDVRFAALTEEQADALPVSLAMLSGRLAHAGSRQAGRHAVPMAEPAPDPIALARADAYAQGAEDARAAAAQDSAEAEAARARLAHAFERLDADLAEQLRQRLMDTVVALCEATLQPLALDKLALAHRVEKAVAMFARADDERVIRLHPDDIAIIRDQLPEDWTFVPDPALDRGTIRVETHSRGQDGGGVEDGPAQWRRAIADALDIGGAE